MTDPIQNQIGVVKAGELSRLLIEKTVNPKVIKKSNKPQTFSDILAFPDSVRPTQSTQASSKSFEPAPLISAFTEEQSLSQILQTGVDRLFKELDGRKGPESQSLEQIIAEQLSLRFDGQSDNFEQNIQSIEEYVPEQKDEFLATVSNFLDNQDVDELTYEIFFDTVGAFVDQVDSSPVRNIVQSTASLSANDKLDDSSIKDYLQQLEKRDLTEENSKVTKAAEIASKIGVHEQLTDQRFKDFLDIIKNEIDFNEEDFRESLHSFFDQFASDMALSNPDPLSINDSVLNSNDEGLFYVVEVREDGQNAGQINRLLSAKTVDSVPEPETGFKRLIVDRTRFAEIQAEFEQEGQFARVDLLSGTVLTPKKQSISDLLSQYRS